MKLNVQMKQLRIRSLVLTIVLSLLSSTSYSDEINWGSDLKKDGFINIAGGAAIILSARYSLRKPGDLERIGFFEDITILGAFYGGAVAVFGLGEVLLDTVSDLSANPKTIKIVAEHRSNVRFGRAILQGKAVGTNLVFDDFLTEIRCGNCESESQKRIFLAKGLVLADELGIRFSTKQMSKHDVVRELNQYLAQTKSRSSKNLNILSYSAATSALNVKLNEKG